MNMVIVVQVTKSLYSWKLSGSGTFHCTLSKSPEPQLPTDTEVL